MKKVQIEQLKKIKNNLKNFERQLKLEDFQFVDYNNGLHIYYENKKGHRALFLSELACEYPNEYSVRYEFYDGSDNIIEIDEDEIKEIEYIMQTINNYSPVAERTYSAKLIENNIFPDIDFYKTNEGGILVNCNSETAEFSGDKLVSFDGFNEEEKLINAYKVFQKINNGTEEVFTGQRLLMREDVLDRKIKSSNLYKRELKNIRFRSLKPKLLVLGIISFSITDVLGFFGESLSLVLLSITLLNICYLELSKTEKLENIDSTPIYEIKRKSYSSVPGYVDLSINLPLIERFNFLAEN